MQLINSCSYCEFILLLSFVGKSLMAAASETLTSERCRVFYLSTRDVWLIKHAQQDVVLCK